MQTEPQDTTLDILGVSTSEWSPLRASKKATLVVAGESTHPSLHSPKQVTQNFQTLRTHGLVSNSIFKQIDVSDSPSSFASTLPLSLSPTKRAARDGMPTPSANVGLGLVTPTKEQPSQDENHSPFSTSLISPSSAVKSSPLEHKLARKSLGRLHESHYVSNSVFRQPEPQTPPPPAASTPNTATSPRLTSPSTGAAKGLLTSNRLHGPRYMNTTPTRSSPASRASPARKVRRKTVTFDEILDVQEFENETSFDTHDHSTPDVDVGEDEGDDEEDEAVEHTVLQLVNGPASVSSGESEPELDTSHDDDSRETSSIEGPSSPVVVGGSAHDDERDSSLVRMTAAERVDSMVDELLSDNILNSPSLRPRFVSADYSLPPIEIVAEPLTCDAGQHVPLPQIPAWTPLELDVDVAPLRRESSSDKVPRSYTQPQMVQPAPPTQSSVSASTTNTVRPRPHISRDAILQRVAREKANQALDTSTTTPPHSTDDSAQIRTPTQRGSQQQERQQARMPRGSEPAARRPAPPSASTPPPFQPQPAVVSGTATECMRVKAPSPVKHAFAHQSVKSPLESLGTELQSAHLFDEPNVTTDAAVPARSRGPARRKRSLSTSDALPVLTTAVENGDELQDQSLPVDFDDAVPNQVSPTDGKSPRLTGRKSIGAELVKSKQLLDASLQRAIDGGFQHSLEQEFSKIYEKDELGYKVKDRGTFQGVDDKVSHSATAGDVDSGKAWKKVRRPSDMHEYKRELRELHQSEQAQARPAAGKVFVMVDSFTPLDLPVPTSRPTMFHCILDNGLHMVKTATVPLRPGRGNVSTIGQEFELIQHRNLEFSLTLVVQRDAHLLEPSAPSSPPRKEAVNPTLKGLSRLFSSPKKQAAKREQQAAAAELAVHTSRVEPMLAYMNREGAFGRTGIVFERVASQCFVSCLIVDLPVHGASNPAMSVSGPSSIASRAHIGGGDDFRANLGKVRGTLRLKLFYLPPLPSVPRNRLPENLADCIAGMQDAAWHRADPWLSGTLTQLGGDCASWRRRPIKAQGQFLICFSTVTKKPTVKIDLSKAVCVEEIGNHVTMGSMIFPSSRASQTTMTRTKTMASHTTVGTLLAGEEEDADANYHVDRSFRITFSDGERIQFFADTEEEKARWVQVVTDLIDSPVPANPLWAQAVLEGSADVQPTVQRKPGQPSSQSQRLTSTVTEEDEGEPSPVTAAHQHAPATPQQKNVFVPQHRAQSASMGAPHNSSSPLIETPRRMGSSHPARTPVPSAATPKPSPRPPSTPSRNTASEIITSTRTSSTMLASPRKLAASEIRVTVHDASNRAAFDRLKRAGGGHHRSRTEDLSASRRY